jgi:hypothetical protein
MRRLFLTGLVAIAIGFSHPMTAWPQSISVAPAATKPNAAPFSRVGSDALARVKKSGVRRGVRVDGEVKKDDSWYRQSPDPCQVEG